MKRFGPLSIEGLEDRFSPAVFSGDFAMENPDVREALMRTMEPEATEMTYGHQRIETVLPAAQLEDPEADLETQNIVLVLSPRFASVNFKADANGGGILTVSADPILNGTGIIVEALDGTQGITQVDPGDPTTFQVGADVTHVRVTLRNYNAIANSMQFGPEETIFVLATNAGDYETQTKVYAQDFEYDTVDKPAPIEGEEGEGESVELEEEEGAEEGEEGEEIVLIDTAQEQLFVVGGSGTLQEELSEADRISEHLLEDLLENLATEAPKDTAVLDTALLTLPFDEDFTPISVPTVNTAQEPIADLPTHERTASVDSLFSTAMHSDESEYDVELVPDTPENKHALAFAVDYEPSIDLSHAAVAALILSGRRALNAAMNDERRGASIKLGS